MFSPMRAADQVGHAGDQPVDVGGLRIERLAPREREQLLSERHGALRAARHLIDCAPQFAVFRRCVTPDRFEVADDDGEQVVEVVRDAAGELADRLHLLRLPQLLLDRAALGEVARDLGEAHDCAGLVVDRIDHDAGPELLTILAYAPRLGFVLAQRALPSSAHGMARASRDPPACRTSRSACRSPRSCCSP